MVPGVGDVGPVVKLDPFLVSEWEGDQQRYVSSTIELEMNDEHGRKFILTHSDEIRAAILALMADMRMTSLGDASDYERLKTQVLNRIQPLLPGAPIRHVLLTEFLIE